MGSREASGESCEDSTVGQCGVMGHNTHLSFYLPPSVPRESGSLSWSRTSFPSQGSGSRAPQPCCPLGLPQPCEGDSGSSGDSEFWYTTHVRARGCTCPPTQGCRVPLTSSGGDFTACWLSERRRAPFTRRRNICREELSLATGSPASALGLVTGPGDLSAGPILRGALRTQPIPQEVTGPGWDSAPETSSGPNPHLADAASRFFHHQLVYHGLQADAQHNGLQGRSVTGLCAPHSLPTPHAGPSPALPLTAHLAGSSTCGLVMVTHCNRSLLIRYSKANSSFTSDFPGLLPDGPLLIGTCKDTHQGWEPPEGKQLPRCQCRLRAAPSQVWDTCPVPTSLLPLSSPLKCPHTNDPLSPKA